MNVSPLTLLTTITDGTTCLTSLIIASMIVFRLNRNIMKREEKITLIINTNTYLLLAIFALFKILHCINTILGDLYGYIPDLSWCLFISYLLLVLVANLYYVLVNQAIFRLSRIVYYAHRWLQLYRVYIVAGPIELLGASVLLMPVLVWHDIEYISSINSCLIPFKNIRGIVWAFVCAYGIPLLLLTLIYLRITSHIRRSSNNQNVVVRRRQERDFVVVRRIVLTLVVLLALGVPSMILFIMAIVTGHEHPLAQCIQFFTSSLNMALLNILTLILTPPLKKIIVGGSTRNQVSPLDTQRGAIVGLRHLSIS